eukprot:scaffold48442_cov28-Prasinocladus_malaysianus.AAC.1
MVLTCCSFIQNVLKGFLAFLICTYAPSDGCISYPVTMCFYPALRLNLPSLNPDRLTMAQWTVAPSNIRLYCAITIASLGIVGSTTVARANDCGPG